MDLNRLEVWFYNKFTGQVVDPFDVEFARDELSLGVEHYSKDLKLKLDE